MTEKAYELIRECEIHPEKILEHHEAIGEVSRKEAEKLFNRLIIISTKRAVLEGREEELKEHLKQYGDALGSETLRRFLGTLSNVYQDRPAILSIFSTYE